jgi:hypothetical protein
MAQPSFENSSAMREPMAKNSSSSSTSSSTPVERVNTPRKITEEFFNSVAKDGELFKKTAKRISEKTGCSEMEAQVEINKFTSYWTEPTQDGKRTRWQTQKTFEVQRRLVTWISKVNTFSGGKSEWKKEIEKELHEDYKAMGII